jgi:hypothetical protein
MAISHGSSRLAEFQRNHDIYFMLKKFKEHLNARNTAPQSAPAPVARGLDSKALAEQKADAAGEKYRAEAEARGEKSAETGGPKGLEPTRYGDWERAGRCVDF